MNWFTGAARDGGLIAAMSEPLEWTERSENEHPTDRDMAHYVVYKRPTESGVLDQSSSVWLTYVSQVATFPASSMRLHLSH